MSAKLSHTTADYIEWSTALETAHRLMKDKKTFVYGLYILVSIRTGLRMSDILRLKYFDLMKGELKLCEQKTGKYKLVKLHPEILKALQDNRMKLMVLMEGEGFYLFTSQKKTVLSKQQINRKLKDIFSQENRTLNISSHSLRKTFGRRVYEKNNQSEKALVYLSELFNHSSLGTTRTYLGIRQEELNDIIMNL